MDQQQKKGIKSQLISRRLRITGKIEELKNMTQVDSPDCAVDKIDREQNMRDIALLQNNLNKLIRQLNAVEQALQRLETEDYGKCVRCGKTIQPQRLMITPEATLCISCARRQQ